LLTRDIDNLHITPHFPTCNKYTSHFGDHIIQAYLYILKQKNNQTPQINTKVHTLYENTQSITTGRRKAD